MERTPVDGQKCASGTTWGAPRELGVPHTGLSKAAHASVPTCRPLQPLSTARRCLENPSPRKYHGCAPGGTQCLTGTCSLARRPLRLTGATRRCLNLGSYNYLGFAAADEYCTPRVLDTMRRLGWSMCSSRTDAGQLLKIQIPLQLYDSRYGI